MRVMYMFLILCFSLFIFAQTQEFSEEVIELRKKASRLQNQIEKELKELKPDSLQLLIQEVDRTFNQCRERHPAEYCKDVAFNMLAEGLMDIYKRLEKVKNLLLNLLDIQHRLQKIDTNNEYKFNISELAIWGESIRDSFMKLVDMLPPELRSKIGRNINSYYNELRRSYKYGFRGGIKDEERRVLNSILKVESVLLSIRSYLRRLLEEGIPSIRIAGSTEFDKYLDYLGRAFSKFFGSNSEEEEFNHEDLKGLNFKDFIEK